MVSWWAFLFGAYKRFVISYFKLTLGGSDYIATEAGRGWKNAMMTWYQKFKESVFFRKLFLLAFVTSLILFRTLLNRQLWMNPLSDVMGGLLYYVVMKARKRL